MSLVICKAALSCIACVNIRLKIYVFKFCATIINILITFLKHLRAFHFTNDIPNELYYISVLISLSEFSGATALPISYVSY